MPLLGVTGGIATGKSTAAKLISDRLGCFLFSADDCVRGLLADDESVQKEVIESFGEGILNSKLEVDRGKLRALVFESERDRRRLESILHPRVRKAWLEQARASERNGAFFVAEIPLLFETGGDAECDRVVTVGCLKQTQLDRLRKHRGLPPELAERIIGAQESLEEKMRRSSHVIWNDSSHLDSLESQVALLSSHLLQH